MKRILTLLLLLINTSIYAADSTVTSLTAASALSGPELSYCVQGGADRKCTVTQIQTFILASPTITGTAVIPTPFTLGATSVTSTGTQLNYLNAATGTTGTASTNVVFSTSPTLVTPILGTPTSVTLTNATGLPIASGISGLGTGVATALAVNVGSAGAFVTLNGALGTPSSGTLTNATGLPISTGVSGLGTGIATWLATPSSANLISAMTDETGTGALVFATTPTLVTPVLGVATATSVNKVTITAPATSSTLTIADGSSLITSGANSITLTSAGATNVTLPTSGTLAILGANTFTGIQTLPAGAVGAPSLTWSTDTTTGFYRPSANVIGVATSGVQNFAFSGQNFTFNSDVILRRGAAATLQFGSTDAASPVAQFTQVQRVVAGTSNTAGQVWTFKDSAGTGTGISGGYKFQVAPAGSTGTTQNTYSDALTIAGGTGIITHAFATVLTGTTTAAAINASATITGTSANSFVAGANGGSAGNVALQGSTSGAINITTDATASTIIIAPISNASTTSALCYNTGSGVITYNSTVGTCTVSILTAKNLQGYLTSDEGYNIVMAMQPWRYTMKPGASYIPGEQIGFIADFVEDERLVAYNKDGTIGGFRYEQYTAALTAALHKAFERIEVLETLLGVK